MGSIEIDLSDMVVDKTIQMDGELEPLVDGKSVVIQIGNKDLEAAKIFFAVK